MTGWHESCHRSASVTDPSSFRAGIPGLQSVAIRSRAEPGVEPGLNQGSNQAPPLGIDGFARATVAIFESPDFFPRILRHDAVEGIGRGALVDLYVEELRRLSGPCPPLRGEPNSSGDYAAAVQAQPRSGRSASSREI